MGPLRPSNVHWDKEKKRVSVSPVHISYETTASCHSRSTLIFDSHDLTCITPERYKGNKINLKSDQYHLGLLGLELLFGEAPVRVERFSDFERKVAFFNDPHASFRELSTEQPALAFVLARMLESEPENRFEQIVDAMKALEDAANGRLPECVRNRAKDFYKANLTKEMDMDTKFYEKFYDAFRKDKSINELFSGKNMESQYDKLRGALVELLDFRAGSEPTSLSVRVIEHKGYGVKAAFFDRFSDAFLEAFDEVWMNKKTARRYDRVAWCATLRAGISYMKRMLEAEDKRVSDDVKTALPANVVRL